MATTGMAAKKDGTIFRSVRTRGLLLYAMSEAMLEEGRWLAGVKFQPRRCTAPKLDKALWYCESGTDDQDAGKDCAAWIEQYPFSIEDGLRDSTLGASVTDIVELLRSRYSETISWAFGATITGQNTSFDGLTFPSQAHAPDAGFGAGTAAVKALAMLENDLAKTLHGAVGMIHVSPGMLITLNAGGALEVSSSDTEIRTPSGHLVVADAGYYQAAPPTGQAASVAGTSEWIYASGPIEYKAQPFMVIGDSPSDYTDPFHNKVERLSQAQGIFLFDPCAVTAVLATY